MNTTSDEKKGIPQPRQRTGREPKVGRVGTLAERYWRKVVKGDGDACWGWTGFVDRKGYGRIQVARKPASAHRVSWEIQNGPVPSGMHVLHTCDNPICSNPSHLWLGTQRDNMADMRAKGRAWEFGRRVRNANSGGVSC